MSAIFEVIKEAWKPNQANFKQALKAKHYLKVF